jgi:phytoene synthase
MNEAPCSTKAPDLDDAYARCSDLARRHYENFPVGRLVPKNIQPHVHAVYAFARVADDFADEGYIPDSNFPPLTQEQRLEKLTHFENQLTAAINHQPLDPSTAWIFLPVADTCSKYKIPPQLFLDLLSAFKQDVVKRRYANHPEVLDYCRRSANPIGRLVLHLHGYHNEAEHLLSDYICTALQLANFWQDVSVDLTKDRIYMPQEDWLTFGVTEEMLKESRFTPEFKKCLEFQVNRTWKLFEQGRPLPKYLHGKLAWEIRLTWLTGTTILKKIEALGYDTLHHRPVLNKWDIIRLLPVSLFTR